MKDDPIFKIRKVNYPVKQVIEFPGKKGFPNLERYKETLWKAQFIV